MCIATSWDTSHWVRKQFALRKKRLKLIRNCIEPFERTLQKLIPKYAVLKNILLQICKEREYSQPDESRSCTPVLCDRKCNQVTFIFQVGLCARAIFAASENRRPFFIPCTKRQKLFPILTGQVHVVDDVFVWKPAPAVGGQNTLRHNSDLFFFRQPVCQHFRFSQINGDMRNPVPTWYFKGYYLQYIDGIPFKLKSTFDFSFMKEYGTVFKVYDDQDSGNICFGTEKDEKKLM